MRKYLTIALFIALSTSPILAGIFQGIVRIQNSNVPLPGAKILLIALNPASGDSLIYVGFSGNDGKFVITVPVNGQYYATCSAEGYNKQTKGPFTIQDTSRITVEFSLQPLGTIGNFISGVVIRSGTNSVVQNAKVMLLGANSATPMLTSFTDASGRYRFQNIPSGTYLLKAQKEGYQNYSHPTALVITATTQINNLDFAMLPSNPTITFTSVEGGAYVVGPNPVWSPIVGARIDFSGSSAGIIFSTYTDSLGRYSINNIPAGTYIAKASKEGFISRVLQSVVLHPDTVNIVNFYLEPVLPITNHLGGSVKNIVTNLPLSGVTVMLTTANALNITYTSVTNDQGKYSFNNILAGVYRLDAMKEGFTPYRRVELITVTANTNIDNLNFAMQPVDTLTIASVSGRVLTLSIVTPQVPVGGAKVLLFGQDSTIYERFSDSLGYFHFPDVLPGIYSAKCSKEGFQTVSVYPYTVNPGPNSLEFFLIPVNTNQYGWIKGKVTFDSLNVPVANAEIQVIANNAPAVAPFKTRTNANGEYSIKVPAGIYYASVSFPMGNAGTVYKEYFDNVPEINLATPINLTAGQTVNGISFGIPAQNFTPIVFSVSGVVLSVNGAPVSGAKIMIQPAGVIATNPGFITYTNQNGEYSVTCTVTRQDSVYSFIVSATKEGYAIQFYNNKPVIYLADILNAVNGSVFTAINFHLSPVNSGSYTISGNITDANNQPLAGVFVVTTKMNSSALMVSVSDSLGNYKSLPLQPGKYYLLFLKEGFIPEYYDNVLRWEMATPINVQNQNIVNINASLTPVITPVSAGFVQGIVKSIDGMPIPGAAVTLSNNTGVSIGYGITDETGRYTIQGLDAGEYHLMATSVNYITAERTFSFDPGAGNQINVDFVLNPFITGTDESVNLIPDKFSIGNYPNPFNPSTVIRFALPENTDVTIEVYNSLGQLISTIVSGYYNAGEHEVQFNAGGVPSGIYYYVLRAPAFNATAKMLLMK